MKTITFLLCILPLFLLSQKNFQPGYVITFQGDTVSGAIDYQDWSKTPAKISFKAEDGVIQQYTVNTIRYFEVLNKEAYQRFICSVSLSPINPADVYGRDTTAKTDTVFLRVLYKGKDISLFSYNDKLKERFYILKGASQQPEELIERLYYSDDERKFLVIESIFRQQLKETLLAEKSYNKQDLKMIDNAVYTEREIKKVVNYIEGTYSNEKGQLTGPAKRVRFFVGAGVQKTKLKIDGNYFLAANSHSEDAPLRPSLSVGLDVLLNPNVGKMLFRFEGSYRTAKLVTTGSSSPGLLSVYKLNVSTFSLSPQFIFNVYNKPNFQIPLGFGSNFHLSRYSDNTLTESSVSNTTAPVVMNNNFDLRKVYTSLLFNAGVVINNMFQVSGYYQLPTSITKYDDYSVKTNLLQLQIMYFIGGKKKNKA